MHDSFDLSYLYPKVKALPLVPGTPALKRYLTPFIGEEVGSVQSDVEEVVKVSEGVQLNCSAPGQSSLNRVINRVDRDGNDREDENNGYDFFHVEGAF